MATTPARSRSDRGGHDQGARAAGDGGPQRKRGGWLWLLGLLALPLLGTLLLALFNDDDKKASSAKQSAQKTRAPSAGAAAGAGSLTAGRTKLLPVPSGGLADHARSHGARLARGPSAGLVREAERRSATNGTSRSARRTS